jgi:hypothetical protein
MSLVDVFNTEAFTQASATRIGALCVRSTRVASQLPVSSAAVAATASLLNWAMKRKALGFWG